MGLRGPRKKLAELDRLDGNPSGKPVIGSTVKASGVPELPDYLDDYARKVAEAVISSMPPEVYAKADSGLISDYAVATAIKRYAIEQYEREGLTVEGSTGQVVKNPCIAIIQEMMRLTMSQGDRLGLDPKSRQALQIQVDEAPKSKFDGLVAISGGRKGS